VILLIALLLGLLAGWASARWHQRTYRAPELKSIWLVPAALAPQLLVAYLPMGAGWVTSQAASAALPLSLVLFLTFVWLNRRLPGMPVLLVGLILNLVVIATNGGWMPISPSTASHLPGGSDALLAPSGSRFGQKDVLLLPEETQLALLADRFLTPDWGSYRVAFSLGDVFIAIGAFWLLALPEPAPITPKE
jgi:Family of unknown function (DUF5317)